MSIELMMLSNNIILCCPLLLLASIFPSIRFFYNELALCIRWPKYWNFSISPSTEYSWLISFRIDWFDPRDSQESSPTPQFFSRHHVNESLLSTGTFLFLRELSTVKKPKQLQRKVHGEEEVTWLTTPAVLLLASTSS